MEIRWLNRTVPFDDHSVTKEKVLQYRETSLMKWQDVPTETEEKYPDRDSKGDDQC